MGQRGMWGGRWLPWLAPRDDHRVETPPRPRPQLVKRQAFAEWGGGFKGGKGTVTTDGGGLLKMPSSLTTQLAGTQGTDPEELLAAVHAASFCMALVAELSAMQIESRSIHTTAIVTLERQVQGLVPTELELEVSAWIPGVDPLNFERATDNAESFWRRSLPFKGKVAIRTNLTAW